VLFDSQVFSEFLGIFFVNKIKAPPNLIENSRFSLKHRNSNADFRLTDKWHVENERQKIEIEKKNEDEDEKLNEKTCSPLK